jgi:uncharacterized protein (TIGR03083 family)
MHMSATDPRAARRRNPVSEQTMIRVVARPDRGRAADVFAAEVRATTDLVNELRGDEWSRPTLSAGWSVREMVAHVAGQWEELARFDRLLRRLWLGRRRYPSRIVLDGHNQVQIDDVADQPTSVIVGRLRQFGPAAVRGARRLPRLVRRTPSRWFFPEPPLTEPDLGYVFDVLSARDTWMHRLEICRTTNREFVVNAHDHDVVGQVVRDLGASWTGPALTLELTGRAGGTWTLGGGIPTETVSLDPLELALHLSGRPATGIAPDSPLFAARTVF